MRILAENRGVWSFKDGTTCMVLGLASPNAVESANDIPRGICEVEIKRSYKDRTANQNAMLWKLIGDISIKENDKRTAETDMEVYRMLLQKAGAKTEVISLKKEALDTFIERTADMFRAYVIGHEWTNHAGVRWVQIYAYYGTSGMNTEEMGKVIDAALEYASEIGLDADLWREKFYG